MHEVILTKHFTERWMQRVGNWPTQAAVMHFLRNSVRIQTCKELLCQDGTPHRVLAIYWHPDLDLVMKVDTTNWTAVTVMSRDNWQGDNDQQVIIAPYAPKSMSIGERTDKIRELFSFRGSAPDGRLP